MNYRHLVRRPFEIVARRPYLWLLGLLAGGATTFNFSSGGNGYRTSNSPAFAAPSTDQLTTFWNYNWEWLVGFAAIAVVICVVLFILGSIATGAIIHAAIEHDAGRDYRLGAAWRAGYKTLWPIAGVKLTVLVLAIAPVVLIGALAGATAALSGNFVPGAVLFALLTAVAVLAAVAFWLVLGVTSEVAQRLVVLENERVFGSIAGGLRLVLAHFKELGLGWLILIVISIVAGLGMLFVALSAAIPAGILGFSGWLVGGATGLIVAGSFAGVFFIGVLLAGAGAVSAYSSVYWTLLYRDVRGLPAPAARGALIPAA